MSKRKIAVVTGTRAEYGLLKPLIDLLSQDPQIELQLLVTGMHLSPEFGLTYQEIEKDGFKIDKKIDILLSSDTAGAISKAMGLAQISFSDAFTELSPDVVLLLGDRFEIFAVASAAAIMTIPIVHIHGGETTEGAVDEWLRHAITKMSNLHFPANETYRSRIIQLGENPSSVITVGSLGVDNIMALKLLSKSALEKELRISFRKKTILMTFHPVTLEKGENRGYIKTILGALRTLSDTHIIITLPNADAEGRCIIEELTVFQKENPDNVFLFHSLGQLKYLSLLKHVDVAIGNSSSTIIEAPTLKTAVVNIGDRQKGRVMAENIIQVDYSKDHLLDAINQSFSTSFQKKLKTVKNPYGNGGASKKIYVSLKNYLQSSISKKKAFYDLGVNQSEK